MPRQHVARNLSRLGREAQTFFGRAEDPRAAGIVLMLGLVYTIKVFDVIMVVTGGGPADATQTLTTWAYQLSFQDFAFGQGAAAGNILILLASVFGLLYLRSARASLAAS